MKALSLGVEFEDQGRIAFELGNLARLRKASSDESLTGKIAEALGIAPEEAAKRLDQPAGKARCRGR
jgi:hypothetical protein